MNKILSLSSGTLQLRRGDRQSVQNHEIIRKDVNANDAGELRVQDYIVKYGHSQEIGHSLSLGDADPCRNKSMEGEREIVEKKEGQGEKC